MRERVENTLKESMHEHLVQTSRLKRNVHKKCYEPVARTTILLTFMKIGYSFSRNLFLDEVDDQKREFLK